MVVRCPTCGAAPGCECRTYLTPAWMRRRRSTHAARRASVARIGAAQEVPDAEVHDGFAGRIDDVAQLVRLRLSVIGESGIISFRLR
jgi:hypothetical protein